MFDEQTTIIAFAVLAALAVGGLIYGIFFSLLNGDARKEKRLKTVSARNASGVSSRSAVDSVVQRRRSVEQKLKQTEQDTEKAKKAAEKGRRVIPMSLRLTRAGMKPRPQQFYILSFLFGLVFATIPLIFGFPYPLLVSAGMLFVGALGLPRWFVAFKTKRRYKRFLARFPDAVDIIVRGIKSGLPLGDCVRMIAKESDEPVRSEFVNIIEKQQLGLTLSDAIPELYRRVNLPETNFFCVTIGIQQQAGGNLAEALSNLSSVLRARKKMQSKIAAVSAEAKTGAMIIGSLPIVVMGLIYLLTPDYIEVMFTDPRGHIMLAGCAVTMLIGALVMRKMINFDI